MHSNEQYLEHHRRQSWLLDYEQSKYACPGSESLFLQDRIEASGAEWVRRVRRTESYEGFRHVRDGSKIKAVLVDIDRWVRRHLANDSPVAIRGGEDRECALRRIAEYLNIDGQVVADKSFEELVVGNFVSKIIRDEAFPSCNNYIMDTPIGVSFGTRLNAGAEPMPAPRASIISIDRGTVMCAPFLDAFDALGDAFDNCTQSSDPLCDDEFKAAARLCMFTAWDSAGLFAQRGPLDGPGHVFNLQRIGNLSSGGSGKSMLAALPGSEDSKKIAAQIVLPYVYFHELGHVYLGHTESRRRRLTNEPRLRPQSSPEQMEYEADQFAAEMLLRYVQRYNSEAVVLLPLFLGAIYALDEFVAYGESDPPHLKRLRKLEPAHATLLASEAVLGDMVDEDEPLVSAQSAESTFCRTGSSHPPASERAQRMGEYMKGPFWSARRFERLVGNVVAAFKEDKIY